MTQGIFQKLLLLFQNACHELDLQYAHLQGSLNGGPMFAMYCNTFADVAKTREELQSAEEEKDTLQQVLTYCSMVHANCDQELRGIVELFEATSEKVQMLVWHIY